MSKRMRYDESFGGGEWLLDVLTEKGFRPGSGTTTSDGEDAGPVRWAEIESDVPLNLLPLYPCSVCGRPARRALYDLRRRQRTLLCECCRPRDRHS